MNDGEICHEIHHNAVGLLAKGSCRGPPEVTGTKSDCEAPLLESAAAAAAIVAAGRQAARLHRCRRRAPRRSAEPPNSPTFLAMDSHLLNDCHATNATLLLPVGCQAAVVLPADAAPRHRTQYWSRPNFRVKLIGDEHNMAHTLDFKVHILVNQRGW